MGLASNELVGQHHHAGSGIEAPGGALPGWACLVSAVDDHANTPTQPRRQGVGRLDWRPFMLQKLAGLIVSPGAGRFHPPVHAVVPFGFRREPCLVPTS
jgi:hypothetical protein